MACLLFLLPACQENDPQDKASDWADPEVTLVETETPFDPTMTTMDAQCLVIRKLDMGGSTRDIFLLNICPEDLSTNHRAINIAPPDELSVTAYFDTVRSFPNAAEAQKYAEANGIFDVYLP